MRTTRRLRCSVCTPAVLNRCSGTSWKVITTRVSRVGSRLPVRSRKGTPGPAPRLEVQAQRGVRLRGGLRRDPGLLAIRRDLLARRSSRPCTGRGRRRAGGSAGSTASTFTFSLRIASASKDSGGSIATSDEHLEHVVLDDVADGADLLVQLAALLDAEGLGDGDLHPCDRVAIPHPLEERVAEPEDEEVLNRLLAHVVVDAEDALLGNDVVERLVERLGRLQVVPERFLDDDRRALGQSRRLDAFDERRECRRRHREVCDAPIAASLAERSGERSPSGGSGTKCSRCRERREHGLLQRRPRELLDRRFQRGRGSADRPSRTARRR